MLPPVRAAGAECAPVHGAAGRRGGGSSRRGRAGRAAAAVAGRERAQRGVMARAVARRARDQQRRQPAQAQRERGRARGSARPKLNKDLLCVRLRGARAGRSARSRRIPSLNGGFRQADAVALATWWTTTRAGKAAQALDTYRQEACRSYASHLSVRTYVYAEQLR